MLGDKQFKDSQASSFQTTNLRNDEKDFEQPTGDKPCGIIVFGVAGAGKSTFLNQMMGSGIFKTSDTVGSCT